MLRGERGGLSSIVIRSPWCMWCDGPYFPETVDGSLSAIRWYEAKIDTPRRKEEKIEGNIVANLSMGSPFFWSLVGFDDESSSVKEETL